MKTNDPVINYYRTIESKLGYRWLGGIKHFGYYPKGKEDISKTEAQHLMNHQLALALGLPKESIVLDAGCGEGGVAFFLRKKYGLIVHGIDILDFNIEKAKKVAKHDRVDPKLFQVATYQKLPFPDNSFDGLYTIETLVHSPDYKKAMAEFHRVLKPGGKLALFEYTITPKAESADERAYKAIRKVNELASMPAFNEFEHNTFEQKLSAAGFKDIEEADITERMLPMLKEFYHKARIPYEIIKRLGLQEHFVNAMSAVEFFKHRELWRYVVVTAVNKYS